MRRYGLENMVKEINDLITENDVLADRLEDVKLKMLEYKALFYGRNEIVEKIREVIHHNISSNTFYGYDIKKTIKDCDFTEEEREFLKEYF